MDDMLGKLKKFVQKKKLDTKFKKAGSGHSLAQDATGTTGARAAPRAAPRPSGRQTQIDEATRAANAQRLAAAVEQRMGPQKPDNASRSKAAIREQARRQIEAMERASDGSGVAPGPGDIGFEKPSGPVERELEYAPVLAVSGVYFTCDLLGDDVILPKDEMINTVKDLLRQQMEEDPVTASCIMLHSMNANRDRREAAIGTINKYMDNIITQPDEPKYRKIRLGNAAFKEKVLGVQGGLEFMNSIGFTAQPLPGPDGNEEQFLVMSDEKANDTGALVQAKEALQESVTIPLKLYRNPRVLRPSQPIDANARLPDEFFDLSAEEIRRMQDDVSTQVDQLLSLRTREMRERDATLRRFKYKYTLVRVKFPDNFVLEGTFGTLEKFSVLRQFVDERLKRPGLPFILNDIASGAALTSDDDERSLMELKLFPAATLHFAWPDEISLAWQQSKMPVAFLSERWIGVERA